MVQGNTSVVNAQQVTNAINSVTIQNIQSCNADIGASQIFTVTGDNNNIENVLLNQTVSANIQCFGDTNNQVNLANNIADQLAATASTNAGFLLGFAFSADVTNTLQTVNVVQQNMVQNISKCNLSAPVQQEFDVNGSYNSIVAVTMNQQADFFCKCVFGTTNVSNLSNTVAQQLNANANATTGINLSNIVSIFLIIVIIVAAVAAVGVASKFLMKYNAQQKNIKANELYYGKSADNEKDVITNREKLNAVKAYQQEVTSNSTTTDAAKAALKAATATGSK
jgi:hypothetical protein